jgi:hypothetical protein
LPREPFIGRQPEVQVSLRGWLIVAGVLAVGHRKDAKHLDHRRRRLVRRQDDPIDPGVDRDAVAGMKSGGRAGEHGPHEHETDEARKVHKSPSRSRTVRAVKC